MAGIVSGVAGVAVGSSQSVQQPVVNPAPAYPYPVNGSSHYNSGTETIIGNTNQSGTFKGHGVGARIEGGFTAGGNIS